MKTHTALFLAALLALTAGCDTLDSFCDPAGVEEVDAVWIGSNGLTAKNIPGGVVGDLDPMLEDTKPECRPTDIWCNHSTSSALATYTCGDFSATVDVAAGNCLRFCYPGSTAPCTEESRETTQIGCEPNELKVCVGVGCTWETIFDCRPDGNEEE